MNKRLDIEEAVVRIAAILPERRPIEHHEPQITGNEAAYVANCMASDPVGYSYIKRFEDGLRKATGATQILALSSGTAALHLALVVAGVRLGDEVLVPALTFAGTANAVMHAGAIPNFVDGALNINPYKLRCYLARETVATGKGRVNKRTERPVTALIVVHLLGIPAAMTELEQVASEFGLTLIEDAAEALGSKYGNKACGSFGAVSALSFNCNKIVTSGGGGALLTSDPWLAAKAYQLATTARVQHPWKVEHDAIAWNYRMTNTTAAFGLAQLEQLDTFIAKKQKLASRYLLECLYGLEGWKMYIAPDDGNCWLNAIVVDYPEDRDLLLAALHAEGIRARAIFTPLHKLPMYKDNPHDNLGYAEDTASKMVCLPSGAGLIQ